MLEVKQELLSALGQVLESLVAGGAQRAQFESPKVASHGDMATTAAMQLAKTLRTPPQRSAPVASGAARPH